MIQIRPVSDLRNKFTEIERAVSGGEPVYLTKNGYGSMVVMSLEKYAEITDDTEMKLSEADKFTEQSESAYADALLRDAAEVDAAIANGTTKVYDSLDELFASWRCNDE